MNTFKLYASIIIVLVVCGLATTAYVQHQTIESTKTELADVKANYEGLAKSIKDAEDNLALLRTDLSTISQQSTQMRKQLKSISKPTATADNTQAIQDQSNALSKQIFGGIK